jgi:hypothetical protein
LDPSEELRKLAAQRMAQEAPISDLNLDSFEVQWTLTVEAPAGADLTIRDAAGSQAFAGKATITVEGLKAGTSIEVIDEHRSIKAAAGKFTDTFAPLGEHIYRLDL